MYMAKHGVFKVSKLQGHCAIQEIAARVSRFR